MENDMALVLGLGIGDVVDVAAHWISVLSVNSGSSATLISNGGRKISITADQMTEIAPEVWVGLGPDVATSRLRVVIDAPRHLPIRRRF